MQDQDLLRYSRQILLPGFDIEGQTAIQNKTVVIIGLGGLGCIAARLLAGAGVGHLLLIDGDTVSVNNLHRQILYNETDIGLSKAMVSETILNKVNPNVRTTAINSRLEDLSAEELEGADLMLDCCDNIETRFHINKISREKNIPYLYAAAIQYEGILTMFNPLQQDSPCLRCWFHEGFKDSRSCQNSGILPSVVNTIGGLQATEALKFLTGTGQTLVGRAMIYDGLYNQWQTIRIPQRQDCFYAHNDKNQS